MALTQVPNAMLSSDLQGVTPGFKNRIINGNMAIAQRGTGSFSVDNGMYYYGADRMAAYGSLASSKFTVQQNAGSVTPPPDFKYYYGCTSSSAYTVGSTDQFILRNNIEGYNVADLAWGTANAKTITISFWVRSSLTGAFGASLYNSDGTRSYPYNYTISAANTWEYKTVTIPGCTDGTWLTTNGLGITVGFSLGAGSTMGTTANAWASGYYPQPTGSVSVVGTNGATLYITGLQLEKGSVATSFDYRSYGQELLLCQRYYQKSKSESGAPGYTYITNWGSGVGATSARVTFPLKATLRATPSSIDYSSVGTDDNSAGTVATSVSLFNQGSPDTVGLTIAVASGLTIYRPYVGCAVSAGGYIGISAEL